MLKTFMLLLAVIAAMSVAFAVDDDYKKLIDTLKQKMTAKDYSGVCQECEKALASSCLNTKQKISLINMKASALDKQGNWKAAIAEYAKILADPQMDNASKIQAATDSAKVLKSKNRLGEATQIVRELQKLPGLSAGERVRIHTELAKLAAANEDTDLAMKECEKAWALPGIDIASERLLIIRTVLGVEYPDVAMRWCEESLSLPQLKDSEKISIQLMIADIQAKKHRAEKLKESIDKIQSMPGGAGKAGNAIRELGRMWPEYADSKLAQFAWESVLKQAHLNSSQKDEAYQGLIMALLDTKQIAEAKKMSEAACAEKDFSVPQRFRFIVVKLGIEAIEKKSQLSLQEIEQAEKELKPAPPDKLDSFYKAAQVLMASRDYRVVREILPLTEKMFKKNEKSYLCRYVEDVPQGAGAWLKSELLKNNELREARFLSYDQSAADSLLMDVSVERGFDADKSKNKSIYLENTAFYMVYDQYGLYLFVLCGEPNTEQIRLDGAKASTLEIYLAPGRGNQTYQQWIIKQDSDKLNVYDWNSAHRQYRSIQKFIEAENAVSDQNWGSYFFIPWDAFYDVLPFDTGRDWIFDMIRWSPAGGVNWGGGKVHEMGKWGTIKWQAPSEEQLLKIKGNIVRRAWIKYKELRDEATWHWQKSNIGDVRFYDEFLLPEIKRLDQYGEMLKEPGKLSSQDIEELCKNAVPDWMEFKYLVSELRTKYLEAQLLCSSHK